MGIAKLCGGMEERRAHMFVAVVPGHLSAFILEDERDHARCFTQACDNPPYRQLELHEHSIWD